MIAASGRISPSRDQVRQLRAAVENTQNTPARLLVDLLYGCGMRVSEPIGLRVKDVLREEGPTGQLVIRGAKGGKDVSVRSETSLTDRNGDSSDGAYVRGVTITK